VLEAVKKISNKGIVVPNSMGKEIRGQGENSSAG